MKTLLAALVLISASAIAGERDSIKAVQYSIAKIDTLINLLEQEKEPIKQRSAQQLAFDLGMIQGRIELLKTMRNDTTAFVKPKAKVTK